MRYYKTDSQFEQDVQKIEKLMEELGITINCGGTIYISNKSGKEVRLGDIEQSDRVISCLPRTFEHERLFILDS